MIRRASHLSLFLFVVVMSCHKPDSKLDTAVNSYLETQLSFYNPYDKDFSRDVWIRSSKSILTAHETLKKIGYQRIFEKYNTNDGWCRIVGDVNKPCSELIDSLLITYPLREIESPYYHSFWNRRKLEKNDSVVFEVLKEIAMSIDGSHSLELKEGLVNDTLYHLVQIRDFEEELTLERAKANFDYLCSIGLHQSAYNLLFERYQYQDIDWDTKKLSNLLKKDTTKCCPWPVIIDDTK